jgi:hypothetical protein
MRPTHSQEVLKRVPGRCEKLVKHVIAYSKGELESEAGYQDVFKDLNIPFVFENKGNGLFLYKPGWDLIYSGTEFPIYMFQFDNNSVIHHVGFSQFTAASGGFAEHQVLFLPDNFDIVSKRKTFWSSKDSYITSTLLESTFSINYMSEEACMILNSHKFVPSETNPNDLSPNRSRQFLYSQTRKHINDMDNSKQDAFFMDEYKIPFPVYVLQGDDYLEPSNLKSISEKTPILFPRFEKQEVDDLQKMYMNSWRYAVAPVIEAVNLHNDEMYEKL